MSHRQQRNTRVKPGKPVFLDPGLRDPSLPEPTLDRTAQDRIGNELRAMYAGLASQPVPKKLLDLIEQLGAPSAPSGGRKNGK